MLTITIDHALKEKLPQFCLAALTCEMKVSESSAALKDEMIKLGRETEATLSLQTLLKEPRIEAARAGYKQLGKDPSRYRLATEALLRRLIKGNGLYYVNNAVDIGNILSVKTQRSIAVLDANKIVGDVLVRIAKDEPYEGIGRGAINIEKIPVYSDELGAFGSPTSDTMRTAITADSTQLLVLIISFTGKEGLEADIELAKQLYQTYGDVIDFEIQLIS